MKTPSQIAKHIRDFYFGGNWTDVNFKDTLADVTWQQATKQIYSFNTIATLVFHINYYIDVAISVFEDKPLNAHDKHSFAHPPVSSQNDWDAILQKSYHDAEKLAGFVSQLTEEKLRETFIHEKYGNYYRNLHGIIEHSHYHLGQIVLIKKMIQQAE